MQDSAQPLSVPPLDHLSVCAGGFALKVAAIREPGAGQDAADAERFCMDISSDPVACVDKVD